jgi:hypothetical protein
MREHRRESFRKVSGNFPERFRKLSGNFPSVKISGNFPSLLIGHARVPFGRAYHAGHLDVLHACLKFAIGIGLPIFNLTTAILLFSRIGDHSE